MSEGYQPKPSTGTPVPPPKNPDGLDETVINGHVVNLRTGIASPAPLLSPAVAEQAVDPNYGPILPPGVAPLHTVSLKATCSTAVEQVITAIAEGILGDADIQSILQAVPRDTMRRLVYEYAGMGSDMLLMLNKQVQLIDSVLNQLVTPDGHLKQVPEGFGMGLKDAMNLSVKCSQMILREFPKVYSISRVQRLEMAIGEVMEKHLTPEQQGEVLKRLEELATDKS